MVLQSACLLVRIRRLSPKTSVNWWLAGKKDHRPPRWLVLEVNRSEGATMATDHRRADAELVQGPLLDDPDFLKEIVQRVVQELLEAEMTEHIGAAPYERNATRSGQRNGHKPRTLRTRVGTPVSYTHLR